MKFDKIILEGLIHLSLNRIDYLEINPESATQIIIGTNGAGKTTVLRQLSPLPGEPADFKAGGAKRFYCTLDTGVSYECVSTFTEAKSKRKTVKGHHSLIEIKNGVRKELNDGGTLTVQRHLVKKIFGITPAIMELMVGDRNFTKMTTQERKQWISDMHRSDVSYAIKAYNVFAKRLRAAETNRKYLVERITDETRRLKAMTNTKEAETESQALMIQIRDLLKKRSDGNESIDASAERLLTAQQRFDTVLKDYLKKYPSRLTVTYDNVELGSLAAIESEARAIRDRQSTLSAERDEISETIVGLSSTVEAANPERLAKLKEERVVLEAELKDIAVQEGSANKEAVEYLGELKNPKEFFDAFGHVVSKVEYILLQMPENEDNHFSRKREEALLKERATLETEILLRDKRISWCEFEMRRIEEAVDQICPNCEHNLKHSVSKYDHGDLKKQLEDTNVERANLLKTLERCQEDIKELMEFVSHLNEIRAVMKATPVLEPIWALIKENGLLIKSPAGALSILRDVAIIDRHRQAAQLLEDRRNEIQMRVKDIDLVLAQDVDAAYERCQSLKKRLDDINKDLRKAQGDLDWLCKRANMAREAESHLTAIARHQNEVIEAIRGWNTVLTDAHIDTEVEKIQASYNVFKARLEEKSNIESIIKDNEKELARIEHEIVHLKEIVESLSPQSGLIAEQFVDFIRLIVQDMNELIESVWAHELTVYPCNLEEQDLDYRFPFLTKNALHPAKDVVLGSKAQKSIFDFAFKVVAARHLGLKNYPMIIDELGADMDPKHRDSIMREVKAMVDKREFSQLWVVSHYASQYGIFVTPDVLVLDESNVMVPARYNEHVTIK